MDIASIFQRAVSLLFVPDWVVGISLFCINPFKPQRVTHSFIIQHIIRMTRKHVVVEKEDEAQLLNLASCQYIRLLCKVQFQTDVWSSQPGSQLVRCSSILLH